MQIKKSYMKKTLNGIITRQISGLYHEIERLNDKVNHLKEIRDNIDEIIDNADLLFGNEPLEESEETKVILSGCE